MGVTDTWRQKRTDKMKKLKTGHSSRIPPLFNLEFKYQILLE